MFNLDFSASSALGLTSATSFIRPMFGFGQARRARYSHRALGRTRARHHDLEGFSETSRMRICSGVSSARTTRTPPTSWPVILDFLAPKHLRLSAERRLDLPLNISEVPTVTISTARSPAPQRKRVWRSAPARRHRLQRPASPSPGSAAIRSAAMSGAVSAKKARTESGLIGGTVTESCTTRTSAGSFQRAHVDRSIETAPRPSSSISVRCSP